VFLRYRPTRRHPAFRYELSFPHLHLTHKRGMTRAFLLCWCAIGIFCAGVTSAQWVQTNGPYGGDVYAITALGTNLFCSTNRGVFRSMDNGAIWTEVNSGLTDPNVQALAVGPNGIGGGNLLAGTYGSGVFLSTDNGTNWSATGLTNKIVRALAVSGT